MSEIKHHSKLWTTFSANPARVIVTSFALIIFIGTLLLMLPISSRSGHPTPFLESLFTATSATCVTGLVVHDTATYFSIFGQVIILLLIQLGGLGLVTFATFFNLAIRKKIALKDLYLANESVSSDSMHNIGHLLRLIFATTFIFELVGALILMTVFAPKFGGHGIWISLFLSVSAYCNAGFDILGFEGPFTSLAHYSNSPVVLITIMLLIICGGLGFIVWQDLYLSRHKKHLAVHTKIVLVMTLILIFGGAFLFGLSEWNNPHTLGHMPTVQKVLNSFFMSVTARTAGYESVSSAATGSVTKLLSCFLMFIGAAPGGTGGGIKVTTFYVIIMTVVSVMHGKDDAIVYKHRIDKSTVYKALSVTFMAGLVVFICSAVIFSTVHQKGVRFSEIDSLFEAVSAFGTVGLSSGVSVLSNNISRVFLVLTMFIGRVGPVSLGLSLALHLKKNNAIIPEAKIMVG